MRVPVRAVPALVFLVLLPSACGQQTGITRYGDPLSTPVEVLPHAEPALGDVPRRDPAITFTVWSKRPIPERAIDAAASMEGVESVGRIAVGTVRLRGLGSELGSRRTVSILAVTPEPLAYDPSFAPLAGALEKGYAAFNAAASSLRGVRLGSVINVGEDVALSLKVGSIVPADTIFDHELVLPFERARGLDLSTRGLLLAVQPDAFPAVSRAIVAAAGEGARVRALVEIDHDENGMVISPAHLRAWFGSFPYVRGPGETIVPDPRWVRAAIADYKVPVLGWVRCHRNILPQLWYALNEIEQQGLGDLIDSYDGCYVPRMQRSDDTKLSAHAYGIAIDFNATTNARGDDTPSLDSRIVTIMERWGFHWGGRFRIPDGMHFEFRRFVRPAR